MDLTPLGLIPFQGLDTSHARPQIGSLCARLFYLITSISSGVQFFKMNIMQRQIEIRLPNPLCLCYLWLPTLWDSRSMKVPGIAQGGET